MIDCSTEYGNNYGDGGTMNNVFKYVKANGGLELAANYQYEEDV